VIGVVTITFIESSQGRYDAAIRDYKKGKFLLESRPGQLLPIGTKDGQTSAAEEQQQKRILDRVWSSVEKAMSEMKNMINSQLQDPTRSVEEQEKTIEYVLSLCVSCWNLKVCICLRILLELNTSDEHIWTYFDSQHKSIIKQMKDSYSSAVSSIKSLCL
jgi:exocyst complex component 2